MQVRRVENILIYSGFRGFYMFSPKPRAEGSSPSAPAIQVPKPLIYKGFSIFLLLFSKNAIFLN